MKKDEYNKPHKHKYISFWGHLTCSICGKEYEPDPKNLVPLTQENFNKYILKK